MKEYIERSTLVLHWIGLIISIYFLYEFLYAIIFYNFIGRCGTPGAYGRCYDLVFTENFISAVIAFSSSVALRFIGSGKIYLLPFSKKPVSNSLSFTKKPTEKD
tara:strand:+ start:137 stop:448 length:312 start_codon:yes stop_codon:yes gene_type:complete